MSVKTGQTGPIGRTPPDAWLKLLSDPNRWSPPSPRLVRVETGRLVVRMFEPDDAPAMFEAINADRDRLMPWMAWAQTDHQSLSDSVYYIESIRRQWEKADSTTFAMGIFEKSSGRFLGSTDLHGIRAELREAEVGYWIRAAERGTGICTEAVGGLISAALRPQDAGGWGLRRIVVFTAAQNVPSRRVCEKLGLRLEQRRKQDRYQGAVGEHEALGYHDSVGYAVLADEWDFERGRAKEGIGWSGLEPEV